MLLKIFWVTLMIVLLGSIFYTSASIFLAFSLTNPEKTPIKFDPSKIGDRNVNVVFRSADNLQLAGWYFPGLNQKAIIFVEGVYQNRVNEPYGTPKIAKHFIDEGYSVLMFDLRGTGESQKARIGLGYWERNDVAGAFNYLLTLDYEPQNIGIVADSMGSIATIFAGETVKNAGAIVLDTTPMYVKPIITKILKDEKHIPQFLHTGIYKAALIFYGLNIDEINPIDKVSVLSKTPLLFFHGKKDSLIPYTETVRLSEKVTNKKVAIFENAKHTDTYNSDPEKYINEISEFLSNNLK